MSACGGEYLTAIWNQPTEWRSAKANAYHRAYGAYLALATIADEAMLSTAYELLQVARRYAVTAVQGHALLPLANELNGKQYALSARARAKFDLPPLPNHPLRDLILSRLPLLDRPPRAFVSRVVPIRNLAG